MIKSKLCQDHYEQAQEVEATEDQLELSSDFCDMCDDLTSVFSQDDLLVDEDELDEGFYEETPYEQED